MSAENERKDPDTNDAPSKAWTSGSVAPAEPDAGQREVEARDQARDDAFLARMRAKLGEDEVRRFEATLARIGVADEQALQAKQVRRREEDERERRRLAEAAEQAKEEQEARAAGDPRRPGAKGPPPPLGKARSTAPGPTAPAKGPPRRGKAKPGGK